MENSDIIECKLIKSKYDLDTLNYVLDRMEMTYSDVNKGEVCYVINAVRNSLNSVGQNIAEAIELFDDII